MAVDGRPLQNPLRESFPHKSRVYHMVEILSRRYTYS